MSRWKSSIDLKLDYVRRLGLRKNRECVYQLVPPDDERDLIFRQWLNRDKASVLTSAQNAVSVNNNIGRVLKI